MEQSERAVRKQRIRMNINVNQRATAGWKAIKTAERLVEQYMVRIESTSNFNDVGAN